MSLDDIVETIVRLVVIAFDAAVIALCVAVLLAIAYSTVVVLVP